MTDQRRFFFYGLPDGAAITICDAVSPREDSTLVSASFKAIPASPRAASGAPSHRRTPCQS